MGQGIIGRVWPISGDTEHKTAQANLYASVDYVLNDEKTDIILNNLHSFPESQLLRECKYVENDIKTLQGACVGSYNLKSTNVNEAVKEMMQVKEFYGKTGGRSALHGVISLSQEESDINNASKLLQLCKDVLMELFPKHQAIFAVHTNTDDLHVHFIVNSVGLNGRKIHQPEGYIKHVLHPVINKYAIRYGFTPNERWTVGKYNELGEYVFHKMNLRYIIDMAIEDCESMEEFVEFLKTAGFKVNAGKHISLKSDDMAKAIRTHQLGPNYTKEAIINRILTKREDFNISDVGSYAVSDEKPEIGIATGKGKLKKYEDMTAAEKKKVIKLLREGKNPWRAVNNLNWSLAKMQREITVNTVAKKYINDYSKNGDLNEALETIVELKKCISVEKKALKENIRKYKPVIDIYKEMQHYAKQAYLYEYEHLEEYRSAYEEYRELNIRLEDNYSKTPDEIASLIEETNNRLLFANAQIKELSDQYRDIKKLASISGITTKADNLLDAMKYYANKNKAEKYSSFSLEKYYLVTDNPSVIIMVDKGIEMNAYGKNYTSYKLSFISPSGEIVNTLDNTSSEREFVAKIKSLEKQYGLKNAKRFSDASDAIEAIAHRKKMLKTEYKEFVSGDNQQIISEQAKTLWSFTSAINLGCTTDIGGEYYFVNSSLPLFYMKVVTNSNVINLEVYEDGTLKEAQHIPLLDHATSEGFEVLADLQKKYGFSDALLTFKTIDSMQSYINKAKINERTTTL